MITLVSVLGLAGAVAVLVQELRVRKAQAQRGMMQEDLATLRAWAKTATAEIERLDKVIAASQREIERLAHDLEDCGNPVAAAAVAQRLLLDPWAGDHPADTLPGGAAAGVAGSSQRG